MNYCTASVQFNLITLLLLCWMTSEIRLNSIPRTHCEQFKRNRLLSTIADWPMFLQIGRTGTNVWHLYGSSLHVWWRHRRNSWSLASHWVVSEFSKFFKLCITLICEFLATFFELWKALHICEILRISHHIEFWVNSRPRAGNYFLKLSMYRLRSGYLQQYSCVLLQGLTCARWGKLRSRLPRYCLRSVTWVTDNAK